MTDLDSKITDVTVYRYGASIVRTALLPEKKFKNSVIKIKNLPLVLMDSTVNVKILSPEKNENNLPFAVDYKLIIEESDKVSDYISDIDKKIEDAEKEILLIKDKIIQIDYWIGILSESRVKQRHVDEKSGPIKNPLEKRISFLLTKEKKADSLNLEKTKKEKELLYAEKILSDLKAKKITMSAKEKEDKNIPKKACIVTFSGSYFPADTRLEFSYMVPGACWAPSYMLYLDKNYSNAELVIRALVCQYTGEDWENVNITLSTALPQKWTDLPELPSLRIGRRQKYLGKRGFREAPQGADRLYSDFDNEFNILRAPVLKKKKLTVEFPSEPLTAVTGFGSFDRKDSKEVNIPETEGRLELQAALEEEESFDEDITPAPKMEKKIKLDRFVKHKASRPRNTGMRSTTAPIMDEEKKPLSKKNFEESGEITASDAFLDFARLRMPEYGSGDRGSLKIITEDNFYKDICSQYGIEYKAEYKSAFNKCITDAASVKNLKLPDGFFIAESYKGFDYAYIADTPVDIPSNNIYHNIKVTRFNSEPELFYVTVPREDTSVFRFLSMSNTLEAPLLRGVCDIFTGGNYTATGRIDFTAPKGFIKLGLGVEQRIKVARNIKYNEESSGIVGSNIKLNHLIEIEVRNLTDSKIRLHVRERIPVTDQKQEDIKISVTETTPPWKKYKPENYYLRGGYYWEMEIKPQEEEKIRAEYTVIISSKNELVNGNRREA
jgi:hypothetical protein